ncbi:hypothetical protein KSP39_PZI007455 [Platanthera zijinensis]|uniref:Nuclear pore protein n=1 Tax=Platanthera zijinensis TaxID=2320716 RepID=A0AAP0BT21_9ASPA
MVRVRPERLPSGPAKKLSARRMGPYSIISRIGTNTYRLNIPTSMRIHPVFNVEDLTPYYEPHEYVDPSSGDAQPPPPPLSLPYHPHTSPPSNGHPSSPAVATQPSGKSSPLVPPQAPPIAPGSTFREARYESITEIRSHQFVPTSDGPRCRYLVHWRGLPDSDDTWILPTELDRLAPGHRPQYGHLHSSKMKTFQSGGFDGEPSDAPGGVRRKAGPTLDPPSKHRIYPPTPGSISQRLDLSVSGPTPLFSTVSSHLAVTVPLFSPPIARLYIRPSNSPVPLFSPLRCEHLCFQEKELISEQQTVLRQLEAILSIHKLARAGKYVDAVIEITKLPFLPLNPRTPDVAVDVNLSPLVRACVPDLLKVALSCAENIHDNDGTLRAFKSKSCRAGSEEEGRAGDGAVAGEEGAAAAGRRSSGRAAATRGLLGRRGSIRRRRRLEKLSSRRRRSCSNRNQAVEEESGGRSRPKKKRVAAGAGRRRRSCSSNRPEKKKTKLSEKKTKPSEPSMSQRKQRVDGSSMSQKKTTRWQHAMKTTGEESVGREAAEAKQWPLLSTGLAFDSVDRSGSSRGPGPKICTRRLPESFEHTDSIKMRIIGDRNLLQEVCHVACGRHLGHVEDYHIWFRAPGVDLIAAVIKH